MNGDALARVVGTLANSLVEQGVQYVVGSPGSRSTPIAYAVAQHPSLHLHMITDERSAAFYALGQAKLLKAPVALFCTSGSAVANYMPAIVEAYASEIPLIVLTADRPHALHHVGAPQTMLQRGIFAPFCVMSDELVAYDDREQTLRYMTQTIARAVMRATGERRGPVHLNIPFEEPLIPGNMTEVFAKCGTGQSVARSSRLISESRLCEILNVITHQERGLIVIGEVETSVAHAALQLAERCGVPCLTDVLSGIRTQQSFVNIPNYDVMLRSPGFCSSYRPEWIIRVGHHPVSKALTTYIAEATEAIQYVLSTNEDVHDFMHTRDHLFSGIDAHTLTSIVEAIQMPNTHSTWLASWKMYSERCTHSTGALNDRGEADYVAQLLESLEADQTLFVANSMSIRYVDYLLTDEHEAEAVLCNRGVNGIDGLLSTAFGISVHAKETIVLIGDLAFMHDWSALLHFPKIVQSKMTIVVLNNGGGGIFSFLPQWERETDFETLFGTPHTHSFTPLCAALGITAVEVRTIEHFNRVLHCAYTGLRIIEVITDRESNRLAFKTRIQRTLEEAGLV
ncbi:MAG: 2-succinyl-5-enolpyruvyl-6-hydroxy-3-cyclohexene-1-carboxylic-acid synthase [Bacilli bacterium]